MYTVWTSFRKIGIKIPNISGECTAEFMNFLCFRMTVRFANAVFISDSLHEICIPTVIKLSIQTRV